MPVTFSPSQHPAEPFKSDGPVWNPVVLLKLTCLPKAKSIGDVIQTSFPPSIPRIIPKLNGFVHAVVEAYNEHRALVLRPDDVWLAILVQFSLFVQGHAEALRSHFVSHEGQSELVVSADGDQRTVDFGRLAREMTGAVEERIVDPALRAWILPDFTTTTADDTIVASIVMLATLKHYFSFRMALRCGIPRVTLEGDKADWGKILERLEKLKLYGPLTSDWYRLLRPVIARFVSAFDAPDAPENLDFWGKVVHFQGGGSGPTFLSGWITAFCAFDKEGEWQGNSVPAHETESGESVQLDGVGYFRVDFKDVPPGCVEVDVLVDDNGTKIESAMLAGQMALLVSSSGDRSLSPTGERDTIQPVAGWWLFKKQK